MIWRIIGLCQLALGLALLAAGVAIIALWISSGLDDPFAFIGVPLVAAPLLVLTFGPGLWLTINGAISIYTGAKPE